MPRFETSLSAGYQPEWNLRHAIREIVSNAIDGQTRGASDWPVHGQMKVDYYPRTQRLVVTNAGTRVPSSALLMGKSDNRSFRECIGTFGEGLPMALLVLSRLRYKVTITNGDEKWVPSIEASEVYGEEVLVIKTRALRKDHNHFSVEIEGLHPSEWEEYQSMFLCLNKDFDKDDVGLSVARGEQVLFQECMKGKVFNKGVLVTEKDTLALGYDLNVSLNRDRDFLDDYNIRYYTGELLAELFTNTTEEKQDAYFARLQEHGKAFELDSTYGSLARSRDFQATAKRWWRKQKEADLDAMAVDDEAAAQQMRKMGFTPIMVPSAITEALSADGESTQDAELDSRRREAKRIVPLGDLEPDELSALKKAVAATVPVRPKSKAGRLVVVDFRDETVRGHFRRHDGVNQYLVSRRALGSANDAVRAIIQGITVADALEEGPASVEHASYSHRQLSALVKSMLSNAQ